ncbi:hypothetical protein NBRC116597_10610 [Phaeobacter sp. NW0010-22]
MHRACTPRAPPGARLLCGGSARGSINQTGVIWSPDAFDVPKHKGAFQTIQFAQGCLYIAMILAQRLGPNSLG